MIWQSHGRGFGWLGRGKERLSLIEVRNFIAVSYVQPLESLKSANANVTTWPQGPISEELVFRSCIIAVYALSGKGWKWLVFGTPMWFGVGEHAGQCTWDATSQAELFIELSAHAHHAFEMFVKGGKTFPAAIQASVASGELSVFTYLF